ncbi:MAG: signal peptidase II [Armatimonadota bacterium]|nr:signal peptidase II [Armatimonadota bacterium]MDR7443610.1 signal peptidase II [Armatimonadota bacterium]MDR7570185.1 signal peptidase II [Armatimonadota bacterium]MDR7613860.1 signal peptidase II [Armatimonadota bacterium]
MKRGRGGAALLATLAILVVLLDQVAKHAVMRTLSFGETFPVLPPLLRITLHRNTGIAFGLLGGANALVGVLAALTAFLLFAFHRDRWAADRVVLVGLGLVLGGAVGNLLDRVRWGFVVDFIELPYWPVFNLADTCIVVGGGLLALRAIRSAQGER